MKVLFAVSNDEISESIVRRYQKEYKEIISYKNVYYFNAILKELQKDKSYDRIVISEELEAFANTQYDQIDKSIFEKLDSISDEASNQRGDNTPIILICSDRRAKGEEMLVKLFGIGVYDALIGNDRSIEEVCRLINKSRSKKEAKIYYGIDSDEVKYQSENENDVSEQEIQNILAHYKKLGKNEDKYVTSFNNIVEQYNDAQLRIISKFLPLNVRAVLEEKSPKYQQIMSFNNAVTNSIRKPKKPESLGPSEKLLKPKDKPATFTGPIVIPSSNNSKVTKLTRTPNILQNKIEPKKEPVMEEINDSTDFDFEPKPQKRRGRPRKNPVPEVVTEDLEPEEDDILLPGLNEVEPKTLPKQNTKNMQEEDEDDILLPGFESISEIEPEPEPEQKLEPELTQPQRVDERPSQYESYNNNYSESDEDTILPGFENINSAEQQINNQENNKTILPGFETVRNKRNIPNAFDAVKNDKNYQQTNDDDMFDELDDLDDYNENENDNKQEESYETYEENTYQPDYSNNYIPEVETPKEDDYTGMVNQYEQYQPQEQYNPMANSDLSRLLSSDKKVATFIGTSKNGTSFIVNNLAEYASSIGINVAILDTTRNKNSYYIYTKNEEELRQVAGQCLDNLVNGQAYGISVNRNLTVYTSLPEDRENLNEVDQILETLLRKHNLVLIDTDYESPLGYFAEAQEIYLVQSLDILTIQPLTAFLRELKAHNILDETKLKIILNKYVKVRGISDKTIIGGMSKYNDPAMSFMTDLFDVSTADYRVIPFEEDIYTRYLESVINCDVSIKGYSKTFMQVLKELTNWVYPMTSGNNSTYRPPSTTSYNTFSTDINNTLNQMKRRY